MEESSKYSRRVEKLTPIRRKTFIYNACKSSALRSSMGDRSQDDGEVYVVLTREERGTDNFIQRRDPEQKPGINWKATAQKVGLPVDYLKALCRMHLPPNSNDIPQSSIDKALLSVSLDLFFEIREAELRQARNRRLNQGAQ
jgi:hypothetical protein